MKLQTEFVAKLIFDKINKDSSTLQQADLYVRLAAETITVEEYFKEDGAIESSSLQGIEYSWERLKKENPEFYDHEIKHREANQKYGISTNVYKLGEKSFYTLRPNFEEIALKNKYNIHDIKEIEKECMFAPYVNRIKFSTRDPNDLLMVEILSGNIKEINLESIIKAFQKYNWVYNESL